MMTQLETERLTLRRPNHLDVDAVTAFYATDRSQYVGGPVDASDAWRKLATFAGHWDLRGYGLFAIVPKGETAAIGLAGPWHPINWPETEIGWHIWSTDHEGKGFAREAALATRTHAHQVLGWTNIVSYIAPGNDRSIALAKRLGAVQDHDAPVPTPHDASTCLVFRHPMGAA